MSRQTVDVLMRPRGVDRWAEEYAAHITFNRYPFDWTDPPPAARSHKFRPEDDQGLLDEDFDDG